MTVQQQGLLYLIKSALTKKALPFPKGFDLAKALQEAERHGIIALAFYGASQCGADMHSTEMQAAFLSVCKHIAAAEQQNFELSALFRALNDNHIDYMPLKGCCIRCLYPEAEMRMMGDADILIKVGQYRAIRPLMLQLGYKEGLISDHEYIWTKPTLHVELHKRLIPSYNKDYYSYFGNGWTLANREAPGSYRYAMKPEDELIYLFTHLAKHYRDSGIGLRQPIDIWVYEKAHPDLDQVYLQTEMTKLQLWDFFLNLRHTLEVWFDDGEKDSITDFITDVIFNSGQYGKAETVQISSALKEEKLVRNASIQKVRRLLLSVFTPYPSMCEMYPVLLRKPALLPFYWLYHLFARLTGKRQTQSYKSHQKPVSQDVISAYQHSLNYVGLDFNFGEKNR